MTPIDQIRKALEAFYEVNDDLKHSNEDAAEALKRFERAILPMHIAALLASHDAAVQRAAEMQERCAQVCESMNQSDWSAAQFAAAIRAIKE